MPTSRTYLSEQLAQTEASLVKLTTTLTDAELDFRSGPEEWTIREILAHLVDDEMFIMRTRLERMIKEDVPSLVSHDEKKWHAQRNRSRDSIKELLDDFSVQRAASLNIVTFLSDQEWARSAYHPEYGTFTAEEWLGHWVEHDQVHIQQIAKTLETYRRPG